MAKRALPLGEVYALLEPGPVLLVSTAQSVGGGSVLAL